MVTFPMKEKKKEKNTVIITILFTELKEENLFKNFYSSVSDKSYTNGLVK